MNSSLRLPRGVALWVAPFFVLLSLLAIPTQAWAQTSDHPLDPICPWGRKCSATPLFTAASFPTDTAQTAPQGDFTRMALNSLRDGNWEVYVARGDGTQGVNITNNPAYDVEPQLSPDGTQILFASDRDHAPTAAGVRTFNIYVAQVDGSNLRRLTTTNDSQSRPIWSPDGSHIFFTMERNGNVDIYSMRSDGSDLQRLTTNRADDYDVAITADGSAIFWARMVTKTTARLMRAKPDGSGAVDYSPPMPYLQRPVVSPTGATIAHEGDANEDGWLDVVEIALDSPGYLVSHLFPGEPLADRTISGWSPALQIASNDGPRALSERTLFVTTWHYVPNMEEQVYELVGFSTVGQMGWANGRAMESSALDLDFHAIALDTQPPTATLLAPPLVRFGSESLHYTSADTGSAGVGYLEWDGMNLNPPNQQLIRQVVANGGGSGTEIARWDPGITNQIRLRAWDLVGNAGPWSAPVVATTYVDGAACSLVEVRGHPVPEATLAFGSENPFLAQPSDSDGIARAWFAYEPTFAATTGVHPAFGTAQFPSWRPWRDVTEYPPQNTLGICGSYFRDESRSAIENGRFEAAPPDKAWSVGCGSTVYEDGRDHSHVLWLGQLYPDDCPGIGAPITASQAVSGSTTASMHKPTLTFVYQRVQLQTPPNPGPDVPVWPFLVRVSEANTGASSALTTTPGVTVTTAFTNGFIAGPQAVGWVDLSPWAGRAITVTFEISPAAGRAPASAYIDEISITPWETPVVQGAALAVENAAGQIGETLVVTGENFILTPTVSIVTPVGLQPMEFAAPATESELRVIWPFVNIVGRHRILVANPGGHYTQLDFAINLPESLFLPMITK